MQCSLKPSTRHTCICSHGCRRSRRRCRRPSAPPAPATAAPPPKQELEGLDTYLAHYQGGGGLGSQAVQSVLDRWIDVNKRNILEGWLGHVLHGGPVDAANGNFVPRVQMSSLSKEVSSSVRSTRAPARPSAQKAWHCSFG